MAKATTQKSDLFTWKGTDRKGKSNTGEIRGANPAMVRAQLRKQGIIVQSVKKKPKPLFGGRSKPIKPEDIAVFARQLATMMKAGVPLVQSFEIVADGVEKDSMRKIVMDIKNDVAGGTSFAAALKKHPKYFDDLFCNLVNAGEQAGTLETMLDRIATYKEKAESLKRKIKKALTYPAAIVAVAIIVTAILLIKVVPQFAETFSSFGAELPMFTQFVMHLSDLAIAWWWIILLGIVAAVFLFKAAVRSSESFAYQVDKYMLKIPVIGEILYNSVVARFARTLCTTFAAGVPLVDALDSVAGTVGSRPYRDAVLTIKDDVTSGTQLNAAVRNVKVFPNMLLQMIAIGEESGALDDMLEKVANHYEELVDNQVDNLTALLEPLIMAVLGVLVGGLMIAMYLPIFKLGSVV